MPSTENEKGQLPAVQAVVAPGEGGPKLRRKTGGGKKNRPNFAQIHSKPLPLEVYPLPTLQTSIPFSLLHLAYVWINQLWSPPSSHERQPYIGYLSLQTRSVHVTDVQHARALWEMGFFGKGTLSRSEPSWLDREKAKVKAAKQGGGTAEEATARRREERRMFKLNRAREEAEKVERQKAVEEGKIEFTEAPIFPSSSQPELEGSTHSEDPLIEQAAAVGHSEPTTTSQNYGDAVEKPLVQQIDHPTHAIELGHQGSPTTLHDASITPPSDMVSTKPTKTGHTFELEEAQVDDQEHLQLTLEEAFFLSYALGVLSVYPTPPTESAITPLSEPLSPLSTPFWQQAYSSADLFHTFRHCSVAPTSLLTDLAPDDPFLLNYAVYHHFRSLGWVVRPGVKFGCDYLLYNRGPVFSHAEFAIMIMPSYVDGYWNTVEGTRHGERMEDRKDWWWLHCVNRVQSQVKKTLVLCYVEVPPPITKAEREGDTAVDIGATMKKYKVREFAIRRWLANRSRD